MTRKFLSNLILLVLVNFLVKPFWIFGIDRVVQNEVGAEAYGSYFALFNLAFLFHVLLDFGISNFNNREIAGKPDRLPNLFNDLVGTKILLALIYLIVVALLALSLGYRSFYFQLALLIALSQVFSSFLQYLRSNIAGLHHFRVDAFFSVADRLLAIGFCSWLIWFSAEGISVQSFVYAQIAAFLLATTAAFAYLLLRRDQNGKRLSPVPTINFKRSLELLKRSAPFALLGILMSLYTRIDGLMIERMLGEEGAKQAGVYAASFRLLDALNMVGFLFATLLLPMFSRMLAERKSVHELLQTASGLILAFTISASILAFTFSSEIMQLLYTGSNDQWYKVFKILMPTAIGMGSVLIYGTLLTAAGALSQLNKLAAFGLIANLGLNLMLIPQYGAEGAAIATLITQSVVAVLHYILAIQMVDCGSQSRLLLRMLLFSLFLGGTSYFLTTSIDQWMFSFALVSCSALAFALISGLVSIPNIRRMLAERE